MAWRRKLNGAKIYTEALYCNVIIRKPYTEGKKTGCAADGKLSCKDKSDVDSDDYITVVGEHSIVGRSKSGSICGRDRRENAGMSSENYVRIIMVENLRFPEEGSSAQGKPGAKARPRGVVDAHTVEIP